MMRRYTSWMAVGVLLAAGAVTGPALFAQSKAKAENVAEIAYDTGELHEAAGRALHR